MTSRSPALTADRLIVIGRGELIASMSVDDFVTQSSHNFVRVRTPEPEKLLGLLGSATSVVGGGLSLGVLSLLALGIGTLVRRSAGAFVAGAIMLERRDA